MSEQPQLPRMPNGLQAAGRGLWKKMVGSVELREDELPILEGACRTADDVARLTAALVDAPIEIKGASGQMRVNGLFGEVRQARLSLSRMMQMLAPQDDDRRSVAGRALARQRWQGRKGSA